MSEHLTFPIGKLFMLLIISIIVVFAAFAYKTRDIYLDDVKDKVLENKKVFEAYEQINAIKQFAGFDGERVYLILLQNNHELRPTGGFIGTYAVLKVENGAIKQFFIEDSGLLDSSAPEGVAVPRAPTPMKNYLEQNFMYFRDSNWEPDFSKAAKTIAQIYSIEGGRFADELDAVVAIDTFVLESILDLTGAIEVNGVVFDKNSFVDTLEYEVEVAYKEKGIKKNNRKEIVEQLGEALLNATKDISSLEYSNILKIAERLFDEKHILVYDYDEALQKWFENKNWSGDFVYDSSDFVRVVDANLNAYKTDRVVEREIKHEINGVDALLTLTYSNTAKEPDYRTKEYRTYTRVFFPANTEILEVDGDVYDENAKEGFDIVKSGEYTEIGFFHKVQLDSSESISVSYKLSEKMISQINNNNYSCVFVKQPGTHNTKLTVLWNFGKTIVPNESSDSRTQFLFNGNLNVDRKFDVLFE